MKKKFVKVALLSLVACSAPAAFVSCNNDDWKNPVNNVETSVEGINNTLTDMKGQVTALDSKISDNKTAAEAAAKAAQAALDAAQAAGVSAEDAKKYADEAAQKFAEEAAAKAVAESAEQLKGEIEALMAIIEANKTAIADNKALIDGNTASISANAGKIQGNTEAIASILESISSLQEGMDGQYADLAAKLEAANVNISSLADELSDKVAGLNAAITAVEGKCEALGLDVAALKSDVAAEMGTLEQNLAAQIAAEAAKIADLQQADIDIKGLISDLTSKVDNLALSSDLEQVSQFVQQAQTQIAALEAFEQKMTTDFAALSSKVDGIDTQVEANKTAIAKLTTDLAAVVSSAQANATAIAGQAGLIKANADAISQNKVDIKNNADAIKTLVDGDIKDLKEFKQKYESQLETLSSDLQTIGTTIDTKVGSALNTMTAMFMDNLRGLVFIPEAYVGGVESALSYHMDYWKLTARANTPDAYTDLNGYKVSNYKLWNLQLVNNSDNKRMYEAPTLISYHMNPLSAVVDFDQLSIVEKNAEILSRAGAGITLDPTFNDGKGVLIDNAKGTLTLSITGKAENYDPQNPTMPIFALQAKVAGKVDEETGEQEYNNVTSDYAMFAQMNVQPSAIKYNLSKYWTTFNATNRRDFQEVVTNVTDPTEVNKALINSTATTVKWNGSVNLLEVLEIAYEDVIRGESGAWTSPEQWGKYDLKMHFALIDYTIGSNTVSESSWAAIEEDTGVLTACVNRDASKQSTDELGHLPLVYVTVTQGDNTVLNGFIKVKIVPSEEDYTTETVKFANIDFNCDPFAEEQNENQATSTHPLQLMLDKTGLSEQVFIANYKPVLQSAQVPREGETDEAEVFTQFTKVNGIWTPVAADKEIGYILPSIKQVNGTYLYDINWYFDDAYAKQLVYQQANHTATTYVCFEGTSDVYADVYIPLQVTVNEKPSLSVGKKVLAKWFRENDNTALLNVPQPTNGKTVTTIEANLDQLWTNDKPTFTPKPSDYLGYKYYFSAKNTNRTVAGVTYSVGSSTNPNLLGAGYSALSNADMSVNALLVNGGEYSNDKLYANGVEIATLDQATGIITYSTDPAALVYLNMFDSMGGEDRPEAKLGGIVGMVPYSTCDLAYTITNGDFNVAFLRPINVDPNEGYTFTDATANGSVNNVFDMLSFSDWRNVSFKNNQQWLYGYYGVKSVKPNFNAMKSNIANPSADSFELVSESLKGCFTYDGGNVDYTGVTVSEGNSAAIMNLVKSSIGTITYNNNDVNVKQFKVQIPFTVEYELGSINVTITCTINTTLGN